MRRSYESRLNFPKHLLILTALFLIGSGCQHNPTDLGRGGHSYQIVYMIPGSTIFVINDDGTGKRLLSGGSGPKWSPLGGRLAFFGSPNLPGTFLCTMRSDGSEFQKLTLTTREGEGQTASLDWSSDGKQLVFFTTKYHSTGGFAVINADGANEISLTPEGFWRVADWSPNGSKIALEGEPAPVGKRPSIYMVDPDGTGMYNLVNAFAVGPLWRPDGKKIAFTIGSRQDTTQYFRFNTFVCDPDGSNLQQLTQRGRAATKQV